MGSREMVVFTKTNNIAVIDSFKEGTIGAATGKLSGALNNNTTGAIDAEMGNSIQQQINLLEYNQTSQKKMLDLNQNHLK